MEEKDTQKHQIYRFNLEHGCENEIILELLELINNTVYCGVQ